MGLVLCGMWDLPGPGLEPVSPALAVDSTTAPPEKSRGFIFLRTRIIYIINVIELTLIMLIVNRLN